MYRIWVLILIGFLISLSVWGTFYVSETQYKIAIFGVVGAIIAAITSVFSITLSHNNIKERELNLMRIKEKQKVFAHFYNSYFEMLKMAKNNKNNKIPNHIVNELMEFKKGLMNWGSEDIIISYLEFDSKLQTTSTDSDPYIMLREGDKFLKDLRRDLGFNDSNKVNIMSIILDSNARSEMGM